jgi:hypothetical protein
LFRCPLLVRRRQRAFSFSSSSKSFFYIALCLPVIVSGLALLGRLTPARSFCTRLSFLIECECIVCLVLLSGFAILILAVDNKKPPSP